MTDEQKQVAESKRASGRELAKQLRARAERIEKREGEKERKERTRQLIIIGGAVVAECRDNPAFVQQLEAIIAARVVKELDVVAVSGWQSTI